MIQLLPLHLSQTNPHICSYQSYVCKAKQEMRKQSDFKDLYHKLGRDRKLRIPLNSRSCPLSPKSLSSSLFSVSLNFPFISPFLPSPFHNRFSLLLPSEVPFGSGVYSCRSCKVTCLLWDIPICAAGRTASRIQATRS